MSVTLSVKGLDLSTDERILDGFFSQYGNVEDTVVIRDPKTGLSRGFGFVTLSSAEEADIAVENTNETELDGSRISVHRRRE
ncbi:hypothetical protein BDV34DRAFT_195627 [Aspergillus parasiticus]|uniref:RRM domain-containing protein n=1 Tax=Aspergillus parasiticus TaxID=5067 RepID=A0A5N6DKA2_ASPPA|nr:hypothetical protein BDV34DRAFT_195627 [Aspergillus parasiticus]